MKKLSCAQPAQSLDESYPTSRWLSKFEDLKKYKETYGSFDVKEKIDRSLSRWLQRQRQCALSEVKIKLLQDEGVRLDRKQPRFSIVNELQWIKQFNKLNAYKSKYGDCNVKSATDVSLYKWARRQREQYKLYTEGKDSSMTSERVNMLKGEGFVWVIKNVTDRKRKSADNNVSNESAQKLTKKGHRRDDEKWLSMFDKLKNYREQHDTFTVLEKHDPKLRNWVTVQRTLYKQVLNGDISKMYPERVSLLKDKGFEAIFVKSVLLHNKRNDEKWLSMFDKLKKYREQHGTFTVSKQLDQDLYQWLSVQKSLYKQVLNGDTSKMCPEHVSLLKMQGFETIFEGASTSKQNLLSKRVAKYFFDINGERELFYGTVVAIYNSNGEDLFAIKYDDGETHIEGKDTVLELLDLYFSTGPSDGLPDMHEAQQDEVTNCNHMRSAIPMSTEGACADLRKAEMKDDHEKVSLTFRS